MKDPLITTDNLVRVRNAYYGMMDHIISKHDISMEHNREIVEALCLLERMIGTSYARDGQDA
jgi:hypothetical protein